MHIKQTQLYGSIKKYRLKQKAVIFISAATAMASAYAATAQSPSKAEAAVQSIAFLEAGKNQFNSPFSPENSHGEELMAARPHPRLTSLKS